MINPRLTAVFLLLIAMVATCLAQFTPMGSLSDTDKSGEALAITKDGSYIVGWAAVDNREDDKVNVVDNAVSWDEDALSPLIGVNSPYDAIGDIPSFNFVSNDQAVLVNSDEPPLLVWLRGSVIDVSGHDQVITGMAPDGSFVVGEHGDDGDFDTVRGFYEEPGDITPTYLPLPAGAEGSYALASSDAGAVIVGEVTLANDDIEPAYWDKKGVHLIPLPKSASEGGAEAVNSDGTVIAGLYLIGQVSYGFMYRPGDKQPYLTFTGPGGQFMNGISEMSDDASIVVGSSLDSYNSADGKSYGWIWDIDSPARAQEAGAYLTSKGAPPTMPIYSVNGCSADGDAIIGDMSPNQQDLQGWRADITLKTHVIGIEFDPTQALSGDEDDAGAVELDRPQDAPFKVTLSSSDPDLVTVPASVTVPANETESEFKLKIGSTRLTQNVTIVAIDPANTKVVATLTLRASPFGGIMITPVSVLGGEKSQCVVDFTTTSDEAEDIALTSDNDDAADVPDSLTMPANQTSLIFDITTHPVKDTTVVTITATSDGVSDSKTITIQAAVITSLKLSSASVAGGGTVDGTVTLNGEALEGGATVTLKSSNPAALTVPKSVLVAAEDTTATFKISSTAVAATTNVTITATYLGAKTATIAVTAPALSALTIKTPAIVGGDLDIATVTLSSPAPSAGLFIKLASSATSVATVPASITIASGKTTGTFSIATKAVKTAAKLEITAKLGTVTKTAALTLDP